ncbi:MAG: Dabb family protein [Chlorobi bacterium]|nr:Dabb family protein [Chlorobiota bacterium]
MIRHIVFFKLTDPGTEESKRQQTDYLKNIFRALPDRIPQIRGYRVGINLSKSDNAWDLIIDSDFDTIGDLQLYRTHPEHLAAIRKSSAVKKLSAVVDYEPENS